MGAAYDLGLQSIEWRRKQKELGRRGCPSVEDERWIYDREQIERLLITLRQRCWVLWQPVQSHKFGGSGAVTYCTPRVGLVIKPIDTLEYVSAVIPCEAT